MYQSSQKVIFFTDRMYELERKYSPGARVGTWRSFNLWPWLKLFKNFYVSLPLRTDLLLSLKQLTDNAVKYQGNFGSPVD